MQSISLVFDHACVDGLIQIRDGAISSLHADAPAAIDGNAFSLPQGGRLTLQCSEVRTRQGAFPTVVRVIRQAGSFSFLPRDVTTETPIWIPEYDVAVVPGDDIRDYETVVEDIRRRHLISDFDRFTQDAEESYASAGVRNRRQVCPTWLGLGRDMRMFRVGYQDAFMHWGEIRPVFHSRHQCLPGVEHASYDFSFVVGQGASCCPRITRRLDEGVLPILKSIQYEQDMQYRITAFAGLENEPLTADTTMRGSDWRVSYANTGGNMLSDSEREVLDERIRAEQWEREQEVICCMRVVAVNVGRVPRYAWLRTVDARFDNAVVAQSGQARQKFRDGMTVLADSGNVLAVHRLDGQPMRDPEMAVLIQPGARVVFDILIPHTPLTSDRARLLLAWDVEAHLAGCRAYWHARLQSAATIRVPEKPIDESIRAGLLHCDLAVLGKSSEGPMLATIGWYSPIGTESAPIIQYFDSMGWHDLAEHCIEFFFARQRADGFMQNFAGYESETGPVLWTAGEHYRYTRDTVWLRRVAPCLRRAADYLLQWRRRNQTEAQRAKGGYGMVDGKVADPDDFHHSFFLNAGTYLGLKRTAEMMMEIDPHYAAMLEMELPAYREDIRAGFYDALARAPVVPVGDGSWVPIVPPWVEHTGGTSYYVDGGRWFSHGAFASRSNLTGPLWLILGEVLAPDEIGSDFLVKANQYPVTVENAALSQPYYARHDFVHLQRAEVAAFLKTYYNQITGLQDRETYTFWEHFYHVSQHKTHEEAWFLMQTRWMIWLETGDDLHVLKGVPRHWLVANREIRVEGVKSYFGTLNLRVCAEAGEDRITADLSLTSMGRVPRSVRLRLPHPDRRVARSCSGGDYDPSTETIELDGARQSWRVELLF